MKFLQNAVLAVTAAAKLVGASDAPGQDNQSGSTIDPGRALLFFASLIVGTYVGGKLAIRAWDYCLNYYGMDMSDVAQDDEDFLREFKAHGERYCATSEDERSAEAAAHAAAYKVR